MLPAAHVRLGEAPLAWACSRKSSGRSGTPALARWRAVGRSGLLVLPNSLQDFCDGLELVQDSLLPFLQFGNSLLEASSRGFALRH